MDNREHHTEEAYDENLVARLRQGEERAFSELYKRYHQRLYFFAQRFVSDADAKDVVSESFVKLWHKRADFPGTSAIARFLFITVRNRCLNLVRDQVVHQHRHAEILHLLETSEEEDLYTEEMLTALLGLIHKEIDKLSPRLREVFLLSFQEGLTPTAIAERLQLSVQTVKNQKLTAIRLLQQALGPRAALLSLLLLISESHAGVVTV